MKLVFLSRQFYEAYSGYREIEKKETRPYVQVYTQIGGYLFAIPLRSNINHAHVLWTDKPQKCGVDFSKAVIVLKDEYIDQDCKPRIRQNEFDALRGKDYLIKTKMIHYIQVYKKAKQNIHIDRNRVLCEYSTLQYFEEIIDQMQFE
jgi:protein AbiQ